MDRGFDTAYDEWHDRRAADAGTPEPTAPWHKLARPYVLGIEGQRVLEVGCGSGAFARLLAEQGADVVAIDFSHTACDLTRRTCGDEVTVLQADAQDLVSHVGRESFDMVVSLETLEHVVDHNRALCEIVAVTRPGGRIVISTPNYLSFVGLFRVALRLTGRRFQEVGQPVNNVMIGLARPWKLRRLGCRIEAVQGAVHHIPVPGRSGPPIPLRFMERHAFRYLARHVLVVATKRPRPSASAVEPGLAAGAPR